MELIKEAIQIFLHLDKYLGTFIGNYGSIAYVVLFLIIILETGLVVTPFLPGDSLIFAAGAFAGLGLLNIGILIILLCIAAIGGDTLNYNIGKYFGKRMLEKENRKIIKKEYIDKTNTYFEKYGGKTIVIARFVPIVRTCAPFVAGIGTMKYRDFIKYNSMGGILWVTGVSLLGFFFGNIPAVANNFTFVIFAIIFISILPALYEIFKNKRVSKAEQ